ncbi:hypothetical protein ACFWWM_34705 [Streptomyces sp. NPDC058682]
MSEKDIFRGLKRFIAREDYKYLTSTNTLNAFGITFDGRLSAACD